MVRLDEERVSEAVAGAIARRMGPEVNPAVVYLFGSFAKGAQRRGSDVDLAVLPSVRLDPMVLHEEAVALNLQRACEQAIGLAMHAATVRRLGVPQESREAFDVLRAAGIIDADVADCKNRMVDFRKT